MVCRNVEGSRLYVELEFELHLSYEATWWARFEWCNQRRFESHVCFSPEFRRWLVPPQSIDSMCLMALARSSISHTPNHARVDWTDLCLPPDGICKMAICRAEQLDQNNLFQAMMQCSVYIVDSFDQHTLAHAHTLTRSHTLRNSGHILLTRSSRDVTDLPLTMIITYMHSNCSPGRIHKAHHIGESLLRSHIVLRRLVR